MADTNTATDVGQIVLLLTTVAGFAAQFIREGRDRRWREEDRKRQEQERKRETEDRIRVSADLQRQVQIDTDRAVQGDAELLKRHTQTQQNLAENTEISRQAFREANSVNQKIADLQRRFDRLLSATHPGAETEVDGKEAKE
jgi:hypothetical protein